MNPSHADLLDQILRVSQFAINGDHDRRHPDPPRPQRLDREAAGDGSNGIGGGHAASLPAAPVGMNLNSPVYDCVSVFDCQSRQRPIQLGKHSAWEYSCFADANFPVVLGSCG